MFQAGPEILCHGPYLDLYFSIYKSSGQIDGNRYQHMITLITAVFGMFDIIFERNDLQISLLGDHICDKIDI